MNLRTRAKLSAKAALIELLSRAKIDNLARRFTGDFVPILMLHRFEHQDRGVTGHTIPFIRKAVDVLTKRGYSFVDLDEALLAMQGTGGALPRKPIALTIDDGFHDQAEIGAPLFLELGCPVTCFLITGFLDGDLWPWDDQVRHCLDQSPRRHIEFNIEGATHQLNIEGANAKSQAAEFIRDHMKAVPATVKDRLMVELATAAEVSLPTSPPDKYKPMSWQQARMLEARGVRFGPHTTSHNILSRQDDDAALYEVRRSTERISAELEHPSRVFCYPTGRKQDFSQRDQNNVYEAGYLAAVSTEPGYLTPLTVESPFRTPRFSMPDNIYDLIQYCSWIEYAKETLRSGRRR